MPKKLSKEEFVERLMHDSGTAETGSTSEVKPRTRKTQKKSNAETAYTGLYDMLSSYSISAFRSVSGHVHSKEVLKELFDTFDGTDMYVHVYRAVTSEVPTPIGAAVFPGTEVSLSRRYIRTVGEKDFDSKYRIKQKYIPVSALFWDGKSADIFLYDPDRKSIPSETPKPRVYSMKPVSVQAVVWTGKNTEDITEFTGYPVSRSGKYIYIDSLYGKVTAQVGDYIIRGVEGEVLSETPAMFSRKYAVPTSVQG